MSQYETNGSQERSSRPSELQTFLACPLAMIEIASMVDCLMLDELISDASC